MNFEDFQRLTSEMRQKKRTIEMANDFEAMLRKCIEEYIAESKEDFELFSFDFNAILCKYVKEYVEAEFKENSQLISLIQKRLDKIAPFK